MTIGEKISEKRKLAGLTQKELGELMGVDGATIGKYERNVLNPKFETVKKIADALGCNVADLDENLAVSAADIIAGIATVASEDEESRKRINAAYSKLNAEGREKAAERVEELAEIKRFQHDATLYNRTIQKLKNEQDGEAVQKILDHADEIVFATDAIKK